MIILRNAILATSLLCAYGFSADDNFDTAIAHQGHKWWEQALNAESANEVVLEGALKGDKADLVTFLGRCKNGIITRKFEEKYQKEMKALLDLIIRNKTKLTMVKNEAEKTSTLVTFDLSDHELSFVYNFNKNIAPLTDALEEDLAKNLLEGPIKSHNINRALEQATPCLDGSKESLIKAARKRYPPAERELGKALIAEKEFEDARLFFGRAYSQEGTGEMEKIVLEFDPKTGKLSIPETPSPSNSKKRKR